MNAYETKQIYETEFSATAPKQVDSIRIEWLYDESPDLSYLGEYSNTPAKVHIDRKERGDMQRNEYRYFNLGCGDADYIEQDYERFERFNAGDWCTIGCRAVAIISYPIGNGSRRTEKLTSGGLWGIESDSDKDYLASVERDELNDLRSHLEQFDIEWPLVEVEAK